MQKWKVWALALVYAVVSTSPTVYFHGCCCGTEQSWFVPPADCCDEHEHHHAESINEQCCQESSIHLQVDDQTASIDFAPTLAGIAMIQPQSLFDFFESEAQSRRLVFSSDPPIPVERCILFSSWIFYDSQQV